MGNSLQFSIQGGVLTRLDNETAIYPGTVLRFSFEDDWGEGVPLFALFRCGKSSTCFGQALAGDMCIIPVSMAERAEFFISVSAGTEETNLLEIRNSAASGVVSVDDLRDMIRKVNDCMSALLPTGGKAGDALLKKSDADHDTEWGSVSVEDNATVQQMAQDIAEIKADLDYVAIDITSIKNDVGSVVELGSTIDEVTVTWTINKQPESQTLDGTAVDAALRSKTLSGLGLTANKTFTVAATDERGATDKATTTISFYNGVYYGVLADGAAIDSAAVLALSKKLQSGLALTFTDTAEAGQRHAYAIPARYGTPVFIDGETNFPAGFDKAATILFENASGYEENYDVYLSANAGLGKMTVVVSKGA